MLQYNAQVLQKSSESNVFLPDSNTAKWRIIDIISDPDMYLISFSICCLSFIRQWKTMKKINHDDRGEYLNVCVFFFHISKKKPPRELLCQLHLLHDLHWTQHLQIINWIKLSTASLKGNCWYLEQLTHTKNTILLTGLFCGGTFDVGSLYTIVNLELSM